MSRRVSSTIIAAFILVGLIAITRGVRGETLWQLVACSPEASTCRRLGEPLPKPACHTDAASLAWVVTKGTRIICERVER